MTKDKLTKIVYFVAPYSVFVSFLYLLAYWSTFNINIFGYIAISDIIRISLFPLVSSLLFLIVGVIYGTATAPSKPLTKSKKWLFGLIYISISLLIQDILYLWILISFPVVNKLYDYAEENLQLENYIPHKKLRLAVFWSLIAIPIFSFSYGKLYSGLIIKGQGTHYAETSVFKDSNVFKDQKRVKYLGIGGNLFFFLSEDNSKIYISNSSEISILQLTKPLYQDERAPYQKVKDFILK